MTDLDQAKAFADDHSELEFDAVLMGARVGAHDERLRGFVFLDQKGRFEDGQFITTSPISFAAEGGGRVIRTASTRYLVQMAPEVTAPPVAEASEPAPFSIGSDVVNGLSKLLEEAGEVIQVGGKIMALGGFGQHFDGSDLGERFDEELADLLASIDFVIVKNRRNKAAIEARRIMKRDRFETWNAEARAA